MKKFMTLAAMFAAVMVSFTACEDQTTDPTPTPGEEVCADCGKTPCECEAEPEFAIKIDGDFSDWDNLEGVQVATLPAGDVSYEQLKTFKAYADETFIYVFCEFDPENTLVFVPYFDLDGNPATGNDSKWSGAGYEAKAEGSVFEELDGPAQGAAHAWDPAFYYYGDPSDVLDAGLAVTSSVPAAYKNGNWAFEASILRELVVDSYAAIFSDTKTDSFTFGMIQYDLNWDYIGKLPCKTLEQIEAGEKEPMLTVVLP